MAGLNGSRGPGGAGGAPSSARSPGAIFERPSAAKGTDTPEGVTAYLASLAARALGEDPAELTRAVQAERQADEAEKLQKASGHATPGVNDAPGVPPRDLNRQLRRVRKRRKHLAKHFAAFLERNRQKGADPDWKPTAFPALDWRIRSEIGPARLDVTGRKARILAAGLPLEQAERLIDEAKRIEAELKVEDGYRTMRWRDLAAAAWVSWRLSRPVRTRDMKPGEECAQTGDQALGYEPPPLGVPAVPVTRKNPWAGGRVVDGYAREAFGLLMPNLLTGEPLSNSALFYQNGSGTQGVFGYLATPAPEGEGPGRSRALDGELGLYTRWQPPAWKSKFVGPPKMGPDGQPLLDKNGNPQRYALAEHWYHARMCGRRCVAQADRGSARARGVLQELCPWLFDDEPKAEQLLGDLAEREAATEGGEAPSPALENASSAEAPTSVEPPD